MAMDRHHQIFFHSLFLFQLQEKVGCDTNQILSEDRTPILQVTNKTKNSEQ